MIAAGMPDLKASFIQPMLLQRTEELPQGGSWVQELDGFRAEAIKSGGRAGVAHL